MAMVSLTTRRSWPPPCVRFTRRRASPGAALPECRVLPRARRHRHPPHRRQPGQRRTGAPSLRLPVRLPPRSPSVETAPQAEEVSAAVWLPLDQVTSPTLREKLLGADLSAAPEPVNASVIIHDGAGRYLLHLRDQREGIWEPGVFALLGGGRAPGDASLEATLLRELGEEVPGVELTGLEPYAVEEATSVDGLRVPVQMFTAVWEGHPDTAGLREGVLLHWCTLEMLDRLPQSPGLGDLIRRHAAQHPRPSPRPRCPVRRPTGPRQGPSSMS